MTTIPHFSFDSSHPSLLSLPPLLTTSLNICDCAALLAGADKDECLSTGTGADTRALVRAAITTRLLAHCRRCACHTPRRSGRGTHGLFLFYPRLLLLCLRRHGSRVGGAAGADGGMAGGDACAQGAGAGGSAGGNGQGQVAGGGACSTRQERGFFGGVPESGACEGTRDERVRVSPSECRLQSVAPKDMSGLFCTRFLHNRALFQKRPVTLRSTSGALKREGDAHEIRGRGIVFLVGV